MPPLSVTVLEEVAVHEPEISEISEIGEFVPTVVVLGTMKRVMRYMQTQLERTMNTGINTEFQWA
jgi:hypothetical protein